jgi:hypothetical protein
MYPIAAIAMSDTSTRTGFGRHRFRFRRSGPVYFGRRRITAVAR